MRTVNIADLKNNLSAHLERVRRGEELLVKDRNRPIARLVLEDARSASLFPGLISLIDFPSFLKVLQ